MKRFAKMTLVTALGATLSLSTIFGQERSAFQPHEQAMFHQGTQNAETVQVNYLASEQVPAPAVGGYAGDYEYGDIGTQPTSAAVSNYNNSLILERLAALETELYYLRNESLVEQVEEKPKKPTVDVGGRIHLDNWSFLTTSSGINMMEHPPGSLPPAIVGTDPENRWAFRRVRLEIEGENPDDIFWRFQIDFAQPDTGEFKDVYIGWKGLPGNQRIVLGNQKRPIGLDHWNSSRINVFMERPLVIEDLNPDTRRLGLGIWGHTDEEDLFWQYGFYSIENNKNDGTIQGDKIEGAAVGRLGGSPFYQDEEHWFHCAVAGMIQWPDSTPDPGNSNLTRVRTRPEARSDSTWLDTGAIPGVSHTQVLGLETMFNTGPVNFTGEALYAWIDRNATVGPNLNVYGYYGQVSYFLTGESMKYKRSDGSLARPTPYDNMSPLDEDGGFGAWQVALRYSHLNLNDGMGAPNPINGGVGTNVTFGLTWWWSPYARIQFNLIRGQIENRNVAGTLTSGDYTIAGTRYAIDF